MEKKERTPEGQRSWDEISRDIRRLFGGAGDKEGRTSTPNSPDRESYADEDSEQMKIVMRYTHAERIKWVRLMSKIRNMSRTTGINATIRTRRLADGSREGEISW